MMLALEVELLTGRYAATEHNDRWRAEWPPHPARFFSALVAALHDNEPIDDAEREALLWLEKEDAPQLDVDLDVDEDVGRRDVRAVFVPVNDVTLVGDPERKLREMQSKLAELEGQEQTREIVAEIKKARKAVEDEKTRIVKFIATQQIAPADPSKEDLKSKATLKAARWCKPSRHFVTATPIALDRHPGNLRSNVARTAHKAAAEAEASIADACERIGLPRPSSVSISFSPLLPGAQHVRQFSPWPPRPGRARRARVHAEIVFSERVRGPLLIGAGRYFGLGLCLPIPDRRGVTTERGSA